MTTSRCRSNNVPEVVASDNQSSEGYFVRVSTWLQPLDNKLNLHCWRALEVLVMSDMLRQSFS